MSKSYHHIKLSFPTLLIIFIVVFVTLLILDNIFFFPQLGTASWYGRPWTGKKTANGEIFNPKKLTAAHCRLPFGTKVKVTNLKNGKEVIVRINDRGPYIRGRVIDLSLAAARKLGMAKKGLAKVKIEAVNR